MSALASPVLLRCHSCSHFFPQSELLVIAGIMFRCLKCHEAHLAALEVVSGNPPQACGGCGVTFEQLSEREQRPHVPMFMHMKDGCYQLLCEKCDRLYVMKRKDLYGPTPFGYHERKL